MGEHGFQRENRKKPPNFTDLMPIFGTNQEPLQAIFWRPNSTENIQEIISITIEKYQTACKPGSVPPLRAWTTIPLGHLLPDASRDQPGQLCGNTLASVPWLPMRPAGHPYTVLLPVRFALPPLLPEARCALTAPFHPSPLALLREGGLFSVALSLGSPPPAVSRHRVSVEPGLSSPCIAAKRGRPAVW